MNLFVIGIETFVITKFVTSKFPCTVKPVYNGQPWDSKNCPLFESGRYTGADHEKLLYTWAGWGLGRSLLTGGRCSEVAVNTGLTVKLRTTN